VKYNECNYVIDSRVCSEDLKIGNPSLRNEYETSSIGDRAARQGRQGGLHVIPLVRFGSADGMDSVAEHILVSPRLTKIHAKGKGGPPVCKRSNVGDNVTG